MARPPLRRGGGLLRQHLYRRRRFPCALYTGNVAAHAEAHGVLARSTDGWLTWHKHKVMDNEQRPNAASPVHWDAQVRKEGELWQQLIGGAVGEGAAQRGAAHLWTSPDLESGPTAAPSPRITTPSAATGSCPTWSPSVTAPYSWSAPATTPTGPAATTARRAVSTPTGASPASSTWPVLLRQPAPGGRPRAGRRPAPAAARLGAGARSPVDTVPYWIGAHSIPRVLELAGDGLVQSPVPEIETLRGEVHRQRDLAIVPGAQGHFKDVAGDALELELTVDLRRTRARRFGAAVRVSSDGRGARVWYEPAANRIGVDRLLGPEQVYANPAATQSGDLQGAVEKLRAPQVTTPAGTVHGESGSVTLRIFVDRSILEVYCGGAALTDRLYPEPSATGVDLFAEGGVASASTVSVWPQRGTW